MEFISLPACSRRHLESNAKLNGSNGLEKPTFTIPTNFLVTVSTIQSMSPCPFQIVLKFVKDPCPCKG